MRGDRPMSLRFTITLVLSIVCLAVPACANYKAGLEAYERGDYATALREWRPLAEQGDASAQYNLGLLYTNGQGVPQDFVQAYKWYYLASASGDKVSTQLREYLAKKMTPTQIVEAQELAQVWKPKGP